MTGKTKPSSTAVKEGKTKGVDLRGNNVDIGQDVVGGDKVINVKNYYKIGKRRSIFPKLKKAVLKVIKSPWTWALLLVFLSVGGGFYWQQQQPISVCPAANGNYIVLVSKFEALGVPERDERDVSRFIINDLQRKLTTSPMPTNFLICEYPRIIRTDQEALKIAQRNHANIMVWGNYTPDFVEAQLQLGETSDLLISRDILVSTANVQVQMTNEREDSLAWQVAGMLNIIILSKGNTYDTLQEAVKLFYLDPTNSVIDHNSAPVPSNVYEYLRLLTVDPPKTLDDDNAKKFRVDSTNKALKEIEAAIWLDPGNPLLYVYRAVALQRLGLFKESLGDLTTAAKYGPADWTTPLAGKANIGLFTGQYDDAINFFDGMINNNMKHKHWYPYNMRGYLRMMKGDIVGAKQDIDESLTLNPTENWPYMWAASIALREGRLAEAQSYIQKGFEKFKDPNSANKVADLIDAADNNPFTLALSAFWLMNEGQFSLAIKNSEAALKINPRFIDVYLVEGVSYCNLGKLPEADAALTKAIENEQTFIVAYLLRAGIRAGLGNTTDALSDFAVIQNSPLAIPMKDYILAAQAGKLNCQNFLTFTP